MPILPLKYMAFGPGPAPPDPPSDPAEAEWIRAAMIRFIRDNPNAFPEFYLPILIGERTPYGNK